MCGCNSASTTIPIGPIGPAGINGTNGTNGIFGGYSSDWRFDGTSILSNPASGYFRLNNADATLATDIYVNIVNNPLVDVTDFLNSFNNGGNFGKLRVFDEVDSHIFHYYQITSVATTTGVTTIGVTWIDGNGSFVNNNKTVISFAQTGKEIEWTTLSFTNAGSEFIQIVGANTNEGVAKFVFPGTGNVQATTKILANLFSSSTFNNMGIRIYDLTNSQIIATNASAGNSISVTNIVDLGSISNLPSAPAVFQIQLSADLDMANTRISSLMIGQY